MIYRCKQCGECCRVPIDFNFINVILTQDDILRISKKLNVSKKRFLHDYCVSKEFELGKKYKRYFLKANAGSCIFLKNKLCTVHDFKPLQCELSPELLFRNTILWNHLACFKDLESVNTISQFDWIFIKEITDNFDDSM